MLYLAHILMYHLHILLLLFLCPLGLETLECYLFSLSHALRSVSDTNTSSKGTTDTSVLPLSLIQTLVINIHLYRPDYTYPKDKRTPKPSCCKTLVINSWFSLSKAFDWFNDITAKSLFSFCFYIKNISCVREYILKILFDLLFHKCDWDLQ